MKNLTAIIVDDERLARVNLRKLLESHPEVEIVGEASSCREAAILVSDKKPELIFLDIQLGGETGFDLLPLIDRSIRVIFVTAYDEYAIRAFEVNAVDYLLKPASPERLRVALERIPSGPAYKSQPAKRYEYTDSIYVRLTNITSAFIKISSILCMSPVGNYSRLETLEGRHCLVLKTLKQWQDELPASHFLRVHRAAIINIDHIDRIENQSRVYLKNLTEPIEISRRFAGRLKELQ